MIKNTSENRVLIQGTFEIYHSGHAMTFEYAKMYGWELIVALNTDELVRSYKKREPIDSWENKARVIKSIRFVDKVIPAPDYSPLELLKKYDIDVYVVGSEFKDSHPECIKYIEDKWWHVVVSPRRDWCTSTSEIKKKLLQEYLSQLNNEWK